MKKRKTGVRRRAEPKARSLGTTHSWSRQNTRDTPSQPETHGLRWQSRACGSDAAFYLKPRFPILQNRPHVPQNQDESDQIKPLKPRIPLAKTTISRAANP